MPGSRACGFESHSGHMYECKCGRSFEKSQSYIAHCGHCEKHLGRMPSDRFGKSRAWSKGLKLGDHPGLVRKRTPTSDLLVEGRFSTTSHLRNRLLWEGYKSHKCERCELSEWNDQPIPLELHHKNARRDDNRLENLELLCPNCHAQTDSYRGRQKRRNRLGN